MLLVLAVVAGVLLFVQRSSASADVRLALGPEGPDQQRFFEAAAERPDLDLFFKRLSPAQRQTIAGSLARYRSAGVVRAAVKLLGTFDDAARKKLAETLAIIAGDQPDLIAAELGQGGSFERTGVFEALKAAGEPGIRATAMALADPARAANAVRLLVEIGPRSVPALLGELESDREGSRGPAAEALGKLRAKGAVSSLLRLWKSERETEYLTALADIGDPRAEEALMEALESGAQPEDRILLGLGRIGSFAAVQRLEAELAAGDGEVRAQALEALVLAGDRALIALKDPRPRLATAAELDTRMSARIVREGLRTSLFEREAIQAARGKEDLARDLLPDSLSADDPTIPSRIEALGTTRRGREILQALKDHPTLSGFAKRALELAKPQSK